METFDFAIIGAGPGGEAAAYKARELGASVAVIDRLWFGGSCPHIGCVPSKALLNSAARHAANPAEYDWTRASERRDYMVNRPADADVPDDSSHVRALEAAGAVVYRGTGRITGPGRVEVTHDDARHEIRARNVVVAVGSTSKVPPIDGIEAIPTWTNREATLARELPGSLVILGGGPTGCELAQVYARFGVPVTIVQSGPRLAPTDHPRNSEAIRATLEHDGVTVRLAVRALRAARRDRDRWGARDRTRRRINGRRVRRSCSPSVARSRSRISGWTTTASIRPPRCPTRATADCGSPMVSGSSATRPDPNCIRTRGTTRASWRSGWRSASRSCRTTARFPGRTYTEPEAASVGVTLDQALADGIDAFELVADFTRTARGYGLEATLGHVTIVVDRGTRQLVGAAMACPDASAAIHECVLAIKARIGIDTLAETIHAFPSTSRIFNGLFADARRELDVPGSVVPLAT